MTSTADAARIAREHAEKTEQAGRLEPAVFDALVDAGALRRWVAAPIGESASVLDVLRDIETYSHADGATGWCVMIANTTALTSHRLPEPWRSTIYADPAACTGGFGRPSGKATIVDGGLEITGHWSWGSGTNHCTWIGGGVMVVDADGERARTADGASTPFVFFDPADVELLDTWHVAGLKGTASTDYATTRAFVPDGRWVQLVGSEPLVDGPLGRFPFFGALAAGVAACLIGLGARAVDEFRALGDLRSPVSPKALGERTSSQTVLARSMNDIGQARAYLHQTVERMWAAAETGEGSSEAERVELRMACIGAAERAIAAVDRCFTAAGGVAVYETSPLQRVFRDAHVAASHAMVAGKTLEPLGRHAFGLPTDTRLF